MRCSICGSRAIIRIPDLRRNFCEKHFVEYFERRVQKTIERYQMLKNVKKLLVAVSGGKDSLVLLHVLHKLYGDKIKLIGFTLNLGIEGYSSKYVEYAIKHYGKLGVEYIICDLKKDYGFSLDDVIKYSRRVGRPICSICGVIKRYVMNKIALDLGVDAIATGHNLDDLAQFIFSALFGGRADELRKLTLYTPSESGFVARIKPLGMLSGYEITLYADIEGIEYVKVTCPYAPTSGFRVAIARVLDELEKEHPGFKRYFVSNIIRNIIPRITPSTEEMKRCKYCGMPTSTDVCAFCRLRKIVVGDVN